VGKGRRPLPVGAHGDFHIKEVAPGRWEARCWYRDLNGERRHPAVRADSEKAAKYGLQDRLKEMADEAAAGEVTRDTRFRVVVDLWLEDLEHKVEHAGRAPTTARTYRSYLTGHILPRFEKLQLREVTPAAVDEFVKKIRTTMGYESAKKVKSILSAIADFAIRRGAVNWANPTKSVEALSGGVGADVVVISVEQVVEMLAGMRAHAAELDEKRDGRGAWRNVVWHDLPEMSLAMLATGVRIGEVLALRGDDVVRGEGGKVFIVVNAHLIFVTGEGTRYVPHRKGKKPGDKGLLLEVPSWANAMFLRRKLKAAAGPLFPAANGLWADTNNVNKRIRKAMDACGFEWVTSHVWRHTVGTLLDEADLPVSDVAGQLGNSKAVAERHYIKRRATNQKAAAALEVLGKVSGS
jgi:integrase